DITDVHGVAGREIVENEISAVCTTAGGSASGGSSRRAAAATTATTARCGASVGRGRGRFGIALHRDPRRLVTVEGEATHAIAFFFPAGKNVDGTGLVLRRPSRRRRPLLLRCAAATCPASAAASRLARRRLRIDRIREPLRVATDRDRGASAT